MGKKASEIKVPYDELILLGFHSLRVVGKAEASVGCEVCLTVKNETAINLLKPKHGLL